MLGNISFSWILYGISSLNIFNRRFLVNVGFLYLNGYLRKLALPRRRLGARFRVAPSDAATGTPLPRWSSWKVGGLEDHPS